MRDLADANVNSLAKFFRMVIDKLFFILCSSAYSEVLNKKAFRSVLNILNVISSEIHKRSFVGDYAKFHCSAKMDNWKNKMNDELTKHWFYLVQERVIF
jgi:hypothetical protein